MVQYYKPEHVLELGTSLGITTSYLASGNPNAGIFTLEGSIAIADSATKNFQSLELSNIELITGNFDETLAPTIKRFSSVDFAFIDGNHRYKPTINYFNQILSKIHNSSVLIFDDIHWSKEMEQAWEEIKNHSSVTCTIDLFFIGLVIFRSEIKEKQHFIIRF
jgi:predicted O-methyltransferase YrrM